jgi:hypothetical protein
MKVREIDRIYDDAKEMHIDVIESLRNEDEYVLEASINKLLDIVAEAQGWINRYGESASIPDMNLAKAINKIVDDVIYRLEEAKDNSTS